VTGVYCKRSSKILYGYKQGQSEEEESGGGEAFNTVNKKKPYG
jgi:hypothetical protein